MTAAVETLAGRVRRLGDGSSRVIIGITGAPGAGKSTVADQLGAALGPAAVVVPMDGFHLAGSELVALGRADRKGAPDTFDVHGYVALLDRLRRPGRGPVYGPRFDRDLEEPVAGAIRVDAQARYVITEGNYLLLESGGWEGVRPLLDECWFLRPDDGVRRARLVTRHRSFGRSKDAAEQWVEAVDEPNAARIAGTADRADLILRG